MNLEFVEDMFKHDTFLYLVVILTKHGHLKNLVYFIYVGYQATR